MQIPPKAHAANPNIQITSTTAHQVSQERIAFVTANISSPLVLR